MVRAVYLPNSEMAEQILLGALMVDNSKVKEVSERVDQGYFYVPMHWQVFRAITSLVSDGLEANPLSVLEKLKRDPLNIVTQEDLKNLFDLVFPNVDYVRSISSPIHQLATLKFQRQVIYLTEELHKVALSHDVQKVEEIQKALAELHNQAIVKPAPLPIEQFQEAFQASIKGADMLSTGLKQWDDNIGGIFKGSRYIIAGHASVGKSALALNIAWNMAKAGRTVRYLSFEEDINALLWRVMSREMRIPITSFRKGLTEPQQIIATNKQELVTNHNFLCFYKLADVQQMIATCGPCDLIIVDGISAFPAPSDYTKIDKAGYVLDQCQILAHRTGAAVIALSHINSDGFKHGPSFSGLYGGQAATFDPETIVELRWNEDTAKEKVKLIEGHIIKNRYGVSSQTMKLEFQGEFMEYRDDIMAGKK